MEAEVVAVGAGRRCDDGRLQKLALKPGQRVLLARYAGTELRIDDVEHVVVREDDILGVVETRTTRSNRKRVKS
jgi:chaperonin GroES